MDEEDNMMHDTVTHIIKSIIIRIFVEQSQVLHVTI